MATNAKTYIVCVVILGMAELLRGATSWQSENAARFLVFFLLSMMASGLKVRLPLITGTYSLNFLFLLIAIATLSFSETVIMAAASALVQCVWRSSKTPTLVQGLFNISVLAFSAGLSHHAYEWLAAPDRIGYEAPVLALVATLYWVVNTGLISGVLALLKEGELTYVWQHWCWGSLPYYLVGATVAGVASSSVRQGHWQSSLALIPLMGLVYLYYKFWMERQRPRTMD